MWPPGHECGRPEGKVLTGLALGGPLRADAPGGVFSSSASMESTCVYTSSLCKAAPDTVADILGHSLVYLWRQGLGYSYGGIPMLELDVVTSKLPAGSNCPFLGSLTLSAPSEKTVRPTM